MGSLAGIFAVSPAFAFVRRGFLILLSEDLRLSVLADIAWVTGMNGCEDLVLEVVDSLLFIIFDLLFYLQNADKHFFADKMGDFSILDGKKYK